jgi:hypothetical protein
MTILVCGSRDFTDARRLFDVLDHYRMSPKFPALHLIEGCARGADRLAEEWAASRGVAVEHHPADWDRLGKRAGIERNKAMLARRPHVVLAFFTDRNLPSRGTAHMVEIARKADIPVVLA